MGEALGECGPCVDSNIPSMMPKVPKPPKPRAYNAWENADTETDTT